MTVKIISKPVKICSFIIFPMCLKVKISLIFEDFFSEQIFLSLIISKSFRRAALTIANAPSTLCAERRTALTSFTFILKRAATQGKYGLPRRRQRTAGTEKNGRAACRLRPL
ncbi:MAG: hypothetical protein SO001_08750 [Alloprevotella sp.]|nr:hypothetical protein [Alloprevotella sp.]